MAIGDRILFLESKNNPINKLELNITKKEFQNLRFYLSFYFDKSSLIHSSHLSGPENFFEII